MRILVVAATDMEIAPLVATTARPIGRPPTGQALHLCRPRRRRADHRRRDGRDRRLVLAALAQTRYDLALNFGVCGSFDRAFEPGTVVHVRSDRIAELGAEDGEAFLTIQELQLLGDDEFPFTRGQLVNPAPPDNAALGRLPAVDGITVNTVHGNARSIADDRAALQAAGGKHGRRGVHVRLPDPRGSSTRRCEPCRTSSKSGTATPGRSADAIRSLGTTALSILDHA